MSRKYQRKVTIVGKSGNGKSTLGNVLLRRDAFDVAHGINAVTTISRMEKNEENISVVDTPGLFVSDEERNLAEQALAVQKAIQCCPNPHAFLIVLNGSARLTQEEISTIDVLRIIFGEQCLERAIIVLTHIENNVDETKLRGTLKRNSAMNNLIQECGNRFARIDNREPKPEHIERIISLVDEVSQEGKTSFKNDYLYVHERKLKEAINRHDNGPVHEQVKRLSRLVLQAVEKEREFYRKCLIAGAGVGTVCVAAVGIACLGGGSTSVQEAVTNPEKAQKVIGKSIHAAAGLMSSAHGRVPF